MENRICPSLSAHLIDFTDCFYPCFTSRTHESGHTHTRSHVITNANASTLPRASKRLSVLTHVTNWLRFESLFISRYVEEQRSQASDVNTILTTMTVQSKAMHQEHQRRLDEIERAFLDERTELLDLAKSRCALITLLPLNQIAGHTWLC